MSSSTVEKIYIIEFKGPFLLIENQGKFHCKSPELKHAGLYLFTFEHDSGFLIWFDGFSTKNVANRLNDHIKKILCGSYSTLDILSANSGRRVEIWKGFYFKKDELKKKAFLDQKQALLPDIHAMLRGLRIFYSPLNEERRILARIEAAIMNILYEKEGAISEFPDKGMHLEPRWPEEKAFRIRIEQSPKLHGLSIEFEA